MKGFGILLLVIGVLTLLIGIVMDTTVPTELGSRIHNIGLMNQKQNTILFGGIISIIGAIFIGFASRSSTTNASSDASDSKVCPYCAETIKKQAIVCRFCNKDLGSIAFSSSLATQQVEQQGTHDELMARHNISHDGEKYIYKQYRYDKLQDAVAFARLCEANT